MQPGDRITIGTSQYTVGALLGKGVMGAVYHIQEPINGQAWVVKVPLAATPEAKASLQSEFETLQQIADDMQSKGRLPAVPRVISARTAEGDFALVMEQVAERHQLATWIQQKLTLTDTLQGELAIWQIALDYLTLLKTVHDKFRRSVTDRKISDLRILSADGKDRLVVLDWNLLADTLNPKNDIALLGQLFYAMITGRSISPDNAEALHVLSDAWGGRLTIIGRSFLRKCIRREYGALFELESDIRDYQKLLNRRDMAALKADGQNLPPRASEDEIIRALGNLDVLARLNPEEGKPLFDALAQKYYSAPLADLDGVRRQAVRSRAEALSSVERLQQQWSQQWTQLLPVLQTWEQTLNALSVVDTESQALGTYVSTLRTTITTLRADISRYQIDHTIEQLENRRKEAADVLEKLDKSAVPRTRALLLQLTQELECVSALVQSDAHLRAGRFEDALEALQKARTAAGSLDSQHINPQLTGLVERRLGELEETAVLDNRVSSRFKALQAALQAGNLDEALNLYQQSTVLPRATGYQRMLWRDLIEPAFLVKEMQFASGEAEWLDLLARLQRYLQRPAASPAVARQIQARLDKPFAQFQTLAAQRRPSADTCALLIGEFILNVNTLCNQLIQRESIR